MAEASARIEIAKYIRASSESVWQALVDGKQTRKYFMERGAIHIEPASGGVVEYRAPGERGAGAIVARGQVVTWKPERRLVFTFALPGIDEPESRVSFTLVFFGQSHIQLALDHDRLGPRTYQRMKTAWAPMLTRLQTLLESGATGWQ